MSPVKVVGRSVCCLVPDFEPNQPTCWALQRWHPASFLLLKRPPRFLHLFLEVRPLRVQRKTRMLNHSPHLAMFEWTPLNHTTSPKISACRPPKGGAMIFQTFGWRLLADTQRPIVLHRCSFGSVKSLKRQRSNERQQLPNSVSIRLPLRARS